MSGPPSYVLARCDLLGRILSNIQGQLIWMMTLKIVMVLPVKKEPRSQILSY